MKYHIAAAISIFFLSAGCFPNKKPSAATTKPLIAPLDQGVMGTLAPLGKPGQFEKRSGDEIVVCGKFIHTGTPVITWMDPGGYDAYRTERRFSPWEKASYNATTRDTTGGGGMEGIDTPARFGVRFAPSSRPSESRPATMAASMPVTMPSSMPTTLTDAELEKVRGGGWPLPLLQEKVDQFVLHFDVAGISRNCFKTLQDDRDLSVTFMCDIDGTIYQTLDCKEKAFQATKANSRSIGIEIANIGAYPVSGRDNPLSSWYRKDTNGRTRIVLPTYYHSDWVRTPNFIGYPARNDAVVGEIQGREYKMYDLTPQQYKALIHLTATLCTVFPKIKCDYPRDEQGKLITHKLPDDVYDNYEGIMGHYHVQANKQDPGPAIQWDYLINSARALMK